MHLSRLSLLTKSVLGILACAVAPIPNAIAKKVEAETPFLILDSDLQAGELSVSLGKPLISTRATFSKLAVLESDAQGKDGKIGGKESKLASKGDQLFGLNVSNGQITYCLVKNKAVGAFNGVFVNNRDKHTCFIDADKDGYFESSYDLRTKFSSMPIYYDAETIGNPLKQPLRYSALDPLSCELPIRMEISISNLDSKKSTVRLYTYLTSPVGGHPIAYTKDISILPSSPEIEAFGSKFVLNYVDKNSVKISIKSGILKRSISTVRPQIYYNIIII